MPLVAEQYNLVGDPARLFYLSGSMFTIPVQGYQLDKGRWMLLGVREQDEIALGLIGKFWRPVIEFASVSSAAEFRGFAESGFANAICALSVRPLDPRRTLLSGVMRTTTTDDHARRWFRRYWTFGVGSGAHLLVNGLLDVTREMAEQKVTQQV